MPCNVVFTIYCAYLYPTHLAVITHYMGQDPLNGEASLRSSNFTLFNVVTVQTCV